MNNFAFLKSNRFWCLTAVAVVGVLEGMDLLDSNIAYQITTFLLSFVVVRTIDRNTGDTIGKALFGKK